MGTERRRAVATFTLRVRHLLAIPVLAALIVPVGVFAQSPHGEALKIDCAACHVPDSWTTMREPMAFDHGQTEFPLIGMHEKVDCRACHASMVFSKAPGSDCVACHTDVHSMSVGNDCVRCHTPVSWLVDDIPELHEQNGFALVGVHSNLSCVDCHKSDNSITFTRVGNECFNCHQADYLATTHPNHAVSGFSTDCIECHDPLGSGWTTTFVDHDFFPLTLGHDIGDCAQCHTTGSFADASPECVSCHQQDFNNTVNPNHSASGFSTDCASCHTTDPGWTPATFDHDAQFFPIYSGSHNGQWNACSDCHTNPNDFSVFTCTGCHVNPQTDSDHNGMPGYVYESNACLACHPNGDAGAFDHNTTDFPLQGGHVGVNCIECHANGYAGTPTNCDACHMDDYNSTTNPNHNGAQFPTDCAQCHNETAWTPANFDHDNQYFPIYSGNHNGEWNTCADCHTNPNDYSVFSCIICHDNQTQLADDHSDENGYAFNSNACFNCHPNGN